MLSSPCRRKTGAQRRAVLFAGLLFCAVWVGELRAQESPGGAAKAAVGGATDQLTVESVERHLKEVDQLQGLDDAAKEEIRTIYQEAIRDLTAARTSAAQAAVFTEMANTAAATLESVQLQLSAVGSSVSINVPGDATLATLEKRLDEEQRKLAEAKQEKERLESEPGRIQARRADIPGRLNALREAQGPLQTELNAAAAATGPKADAAKVRLRAKLLAGEQEGKMLDAELAAYAATKEVLQLQTDLANRQATLAEKRVAGWRSEVDKRRAEDVKKQAREATAEAELVAEPLKPLGNRIAELADGSRDLLAKITNADQDWQEAKDLLEQVQQRYKSTKEKVQQVGLNYLIGQLLRREDLSLPSVRKYRRNSREREKIIREEQLKIIDLAAERSALTDVDYVEAFVQKIWPIPSGFTESQLKSDVGKLVDKQLLALTTYQQNLDAHFERLVQLESTEHQLIVAVSEYGNYIDEHVLWIQSCQPLAVSDFPRSKEAFAWLTDRQDWKKLLDVLVTDVKDRILPSLLAMLLWLLLLTVQPRLRKSIASLGEMASSGSCRRFSLTLLALLWTLLISVLWPALILSGAWRLAVASTSTDFPKAVSAGLFSAGLYYIVLEFLRQVCRSRGLADSHFRWPPAVRTTLRGNLRWLMAIGIPLVFFVGMLSADVSRQAEQALALGRSQESLSRFCAIASLLACVVFVHRVLKPEGLLFRTLKTEAENSWYWRYRYCWYVLAQSVPVSLTLLTVIGYYYTVIRLGSCMLRSILLIEMLIVALAMVQRWLVIGRRRIAIERAQQRRTTAIQQADVASGATVLTLDQAEFNLETSGEQSRRLLQFLLVLAGILGLWFIWIDVLPALNFLDRFELWSVTLNNETKPITMGHLVVASVIFLVTILATKNIPGLLEMSVLARLPLNAGNRYALITICRYIIIIAGVIIAFSSMGISWASYQWLVAAVTVGLGFGLQEIFANFVSGLIVLFEQPIRVGDVVTIGDVTGVVSRIRMRATTVTNWDHQDFIVPNKEFITGRLLNWTLSNTINRVVITVGVAYGTEPNLVRRILLDIAQRHPLVLDDPEPTVTFAEFGESTLNIVLRCYLPDLEHRLATIHELNTAAQKELNAAGVVFAFPTREVYIRSEPAG